VKGNEAVSVESERIEEGKLERKRKAPPGERRKRGRVEIM
jgi:hypothetical protein